MSIRKIHSNQLVELHKRGLSDLEMSKRFDCTVSCVSRNRRQLGLVENKRTNFVKELTNKEHQIIIGLILGDGNLRKKYPSEKSGTSGSFTHGTNQFAYISWLRDNLKRLTSNIRQTTYLNRTSTKTLTRYDCTINTHVCLNKYYNYFYDSNRTKHLREEVINMITPLSLAVWFMDDGSRASSGGYYLHTQCFPKEEQEKVIPILLNKFNLIINIHRVSNKFHLYISAKSAIQFEKIILPYIINSMMYKIHNRTTK